MPTKLALKSGVKLKDLQPQILVALQVVLGVWEGFGLPRLTITSCNDSKHSAGSLHYSGRALDFRLNDIDTKKVKLSSLGLEVSALLGDEFDVVVESEGTGNAHMHVEYDVKNA